MKTRKIKYRGFLIHPFEYQGCDNFRVQHPKGNFWEELANDLATAKKWVNQAINQERQNQKNESYEK